MIRVLVLASVFAATIGFFAVIPASGSAQATYAATADAGGITISIAGNGGSLGEAHARIDSGPKASGSGAGIAQAAVAESSAPPNSAPKTAGPVDQSFGDPQVGTITVTGLKGTSASAVTDGDPSTQNHGEAGGIGVTLTPGGTSLAGISTFAMSVDANASVTRAADGSPVVTSTAHSSGIDITLTIGDTVLSPVCDLLPEPLKTLCNNAVGQTGPLAPVVEVLVGPADVTCGFDGSTDTAAVQHASAAVVTVRVLGQDAVSVAPGQTVDLLAGTPGHIHVVAGDAATSEQAGSAAATADAMRLDLFDDPLPAVTIAGIEASCGVSGAEPAGPGRPTPGPTERPPTPTPPIPRTGAPLIPIYGFGAFLLALGLSLRLMVIRRR
ncbi:MAG: hypothetical protein ABR600_00795 [Actinomycetota bacterium]